MKTRIFFLLSAVLAALSLAAAEEKKEAAPPPPPQPQVFYNFAELLAKAERIVVAEIGPRQDGANILLVRETIKAPENDPKYIGPEKLKRAAELLANDKLDLPPLKVPERLRVTSAHLRLPPEGTPAIFFLWDPQPRGPQGEPAYLVAHPQCLYELELLAQVKAGAARPRSVADGRYLREWDKEMAARTRQHEAEEALLKMKGGDPVMGLRLSALRPKLSLRRDNSFSVLARVDNTRARSQLIYDGPARGYGVLLRKKGAAGEAGAALILRQTTRNSGTDSAVLNLADENDFTAVKGESFLAKELFFDAKDFPVLRGLEGQYNLAVFFSTAQDGKGLNLDGPVWNGTMVSEEVPLQFEKAP